MSAIMKKILKLLLIFIGSFPVYMLVDFILSMLIKGTFDTEDLLFRASPFAISYTCIAAYRLFRSPKDKRQQD